MHQVSGNRGRADGQADSEQVQASPNRGGRWFRYQALLGPAERHGGHEGVGRDRAAEKQQRLGGGWDPARVGEDGPARPDGEGVAVGAALAAMVARSADLYRVSTAPAAWPTSAWAFPDAGAWPLAAWAECNERA